MHVDLIHVRTGSALVSALDSSSALATNRKLLQLQLPDPPGELCLASQVI